MYTPSGAIYEVSINSTSEEVRRTRLELELMIEAGKFPLIQLPRKSEEQALSRVKFIEFLFPLIQLPRKSEVVSFDYADVDLKFPLIQLPRKSEATIKMTPSTCWLGVSINSTSEEVRSFN